MSPERDSSPREMSARPSACASTGEHRNIWISENADLTPGQIRPATMLDPQTPLLF
jgi:hypothetical protein